MKTMFYVPISPAVVEEVEVVRETPYSFYIKSQWGEIRISKRFDHERLLHPTRKEAVATLIARKQQTLAAYLCSATGVQSHIAELQTELASL